MARFRVVRCLLTMLMLLSLLAACGTGGAETQAPSDNLQNTTKTYKNLVVGFAQIGAESEWRTAETKSIQAEAQKLGVELKFSDAQQKQENQIKAIRAFIAQKVDVIAFSPVVESGFETVLREAKAAKIPVILTDRAVNTKDDSLYVTFMGSDFLEEGRKAGRWLVEKMKDQKGEEIGR